VQPWDSVRACTAHRGPPLVTRPERPTERSPGCNPGIRIKSPQPPRFGGLKGRRKPAQSFMLRKAPRACYAGEPGSEGQAIVTEHWSFPAPLQGATGFWRSGPRVAPWAGFRLPFRPRTVGGPQARCAVRGPGFHPGLVGSVGPSGRTVGGAQARCAVRGPGFHPGAGHLRSVGPKRIEPSSVLG